MTGILSKGKNFYNDYIRPMKWQYLLFLLVFLSVFINIIYGDFLITVRHSLTLITSITRGEFFDFYQNCHMGAWGNVSGTSLYPFSNDAAYEITLYIIFAIWNFPLWIVEQVTKLNVEDMAGWMIYSKMMLMVFTFLAAYHMDHILSNFTKEKEDHRKMFFVFMTSTLLMMYTFTTGTYDIIEIYFIMAGIDSLMKHKYTKFLIYFAFANSMKMFSLFLFLPLVLFTNKKFLKIVESLLLGVSVSLINKFLFSGLFTATPPVTSDRITGFFGMYDIQLMNLQNMMRGDFVSIFVMMYIAVCFFALIWKFDDSLLAKKRVLYCGFIIFATMNIFCFPNPYWSVLVVPFMVLLIAIHGFKWPDLLLECGYSIALLFDYGLNFPWIPQGVSFYKLPLFNLIGSRMPANLQGYDNGIGADALWKWIYQYINVHVIFQSFAVICYIFMLIRFLPIEKKPQAIEWEGDMLKASNQNLWVREIVILAVIMIPIVNYIWVVMHYVG